MNAYMDEWKKLDLRFAGILTGFLGSPEQIEIVKHFLGMFKTKDNITVSDPVMGDYGKLYPTYSPLLAEQINTLVPYADILTPNLTEACILTGTEYKVDMDENDLAEICNKLCAMGPKKIVVSGLERGDNLENFIYEGGKEWQTILEHKVGPFRSGTGDVFSTIIAADTVNGVGFAGIFTAIVFVFTAYLHIPSHTGYTHVGDAFIYLAASLLPLPYAMFVGAGGALLADCLTGFAIWAPGSMIIKTATVLFFSRKSKNIICLRNILALIPAWTLCIGGYYLYEALITGNFVAPTAGIPGYIMQSALSTVLYVIAGIAMDKLDIKTKLNGGSVL
jgi:uncharacterized repeat protein (TIGR04002 family)